LAVGVGFAAGVAIAPQADALLRHLGIPAAAAAMAEPASSEDLLALFDDVLQRVKADYVEPVTTRTLIDNALNGMLSGLDPHSSYMTEPQWQDMQTETAGRFGGIGLEVTARDGLLEVVSPIDGSPAAAAGIRSGDLVTAVNGKSVAGLDLSDAVAQMRGPPDSRLRLTVKRQNVDQPLVFTLTRQIIRVQSVTSRLIGDIGVIRLSEFTEQANPGVRAALRTLRAEADGHLQGLVLDLRNDPGGLLDQAVAVANDFLSHGEIVATRGRSGGDDQTWYAEPAGDVAGPLPMVVLVNSGTASAAEIVAGALQDDQRALVLGTQSFGKGSVQSVIPLSGNGALRLTTARYFTPSGRSIQGTGITPNIEVAATRAPEPGFGPAHESDLLHTLSNPDGQGAAPLPVAAALPAAAARIPRLPPANWPAYDPTKPATDFQLQQALVLVRAVAAGREAAAR
jgi:carboxyl-terminal processing protease